MSESIGVYICKCGPNIGEKIDVDVITERVKKGYGVVTVKSHNLLCSGEGLQFLSEEIEKGKIDRIVIAACTPKMYEKKFMDTCEKAGMNPYFLQLANIREQCAWVTPGREEATAKAESLINAAINRVGYQESLEKVEIDVCPDVLVLGGGVAGLESAFTLAQQKNRKVYVVERDPHLGGMTVKFEEVYPTLECAPCMTAPLLQDTLQKDNIDVFTNSELIEVLGSFGNFIVKIKRKARFVSETACIGCSACFEPCPVEVKNEHDEGMSMRKAIYVPFAGSLPNVPIIDKENCKRFKGEECDACEKACSFEAILFDEEDTIVEKKVGAIIISTGTTIGNSGSLSQYGYGEYENVYTALQLERLNAENGPTGGKIFMKNGKEPKSVSFIYCVGREEKGYCSGICCMYSLTLAHLVQKKLPDVVVHHLYRDFCLPKKEHEKMYKEAIEKGMNFVRNDRIIGVQEIKGKLEVVFKNGEETKSVQSDMVVLAPAIVPHSNAKEIARMFDIPLDERGFYAEDHSLMKPFGTLLEGVFVCGSCQGPKDIGDAVAQGSAAAGKILSRLIPGEKLELEAKVASIDEDLCGGCNICITTCPFSAISRDIEKKVSVVNSTLCRGCGTCGAACPTGSARIHHFTKDQIFAEMKGVVK